MMDKIFERLAYYSMIQVIGFGLIAAGAYYFIGYDDGAAIQAQIVSVSSQIEQEEVKKKDTEATLKEEASMKESVGELSQQFQEISRRLPSVLSSIDINRSIDTFAKSAGVNVKSKKPGSVAQKEIVDEVPVDVTLEGSYAELAQFIYYVSTAERLTRVRNFVISRGSDNDSGRSSNGKLRFEGQVVGYKLGTGAPKE
jgi:type IV pilus assembly protein PilO